MSGEWESKGELIRPLELSIELLCGPWVWSAWISGSSCPDADLVVKKRVRFAGKVASYNAPTKLMKNISMVIHAEGDGGPTETVIELTV